MLAEGLHPPAEGLRRLARPLNETKAENALKLLYLDSFDDIPRSVDSRYSLAFKRNPAAACALAYELYVIGSGRAPPFNQFLLVRGSR